MLNLYAYFCGGILVATTIGAIGMYVTDRYHAYLHSIYRQGYNDALDCIAQENIKKNVQEFLKEEEA